MSSILQPWVQDLGLRHQGVLVSACRGCDVAPRHDPSKLMQRILRGAILEPHCGREVKPVSYIVVEDDPTLWDAAMHAFSSSWDHYPNHYVLHVLHAAEIIGYYGPGKAPTYSHRWNKWYLECCYIMHLNPESKDQLDSRLNADEEAFGELQKGYHR